MAPKTQKERLDDTLDYLEEVTSKAKRKTVETLFDGLPDGITNPIHTALSLERKNPFSKTWRRAVRAALFVNMAIRLVPDDMLAAEKTRLLGLSETNLKAEIKKYVDRITYDAIGGKSANEVALTAIACLDKMPIYDNSAGSIKFLDWEVGAYSDGNEPQMNCYTAVVYWAFHGGAISYKWLHKYSLASKTLGENDPGKAQQAMAGLLKAGRRIEAKANSSGKYDIPVGSTIIYETIYNPLGHTVMSDGKGNCISHNSVRELPGGPTGDLAKGIGDDLMMKLAGGRAHVLPVDIYQQIYPPKNGKLYTLVYYPPFWEAYDQAER
jgi:hypothetical protein